MGDSYQAIYDAVRSRISNGDIGYVAESVMRDAFDIGHQKAILQQEIFAVSHEMQRPSVIYRPAIFADGDHWCVLLGEDLAVGVSGFGKTPAEAMAAFDTAFWKANTPAAVMAARSTTQGEKTND